MKIKTKFFSNFSKYNLGKKQMLLMGVALMKHAIHYAFYRMFGFPKIYPLFVRFSITNMCDSRCKMCHIWNYYNRYPERKKDEITLEEFKKFIRKNPFLQDIILTGGQPTLRKDILAMWLYLDKKGYRTGGPTNAVDLKHIKKIHSTLLKNMSGENRHSISISIDGLREEHDSIRGAKGDFDKCLELIKWAKEKQKQYSFFEFNVSHNITPSNYKNFPKFFDFFVKEIGLKPRQITFRPTQDIERCKLVSNTKELVTANKISNLAKEINKVIIHVARKYNIVDYYVKGLNKFYKNPSKQVIPCYAGFSSLFIDAFGNVYPCTSMENAKIGNLRDCDMSLKKMWNSKNMKKIQKAIKKNKCPNCWTRCYSGYSVLSDPVQLAWLGFTNVNNFLK